MEKNEGKLLFGLLLVFLGVGFLIDQTGFLRAFGITFGDVINLLWPLFFAIIGILFLGRNRIGVGLTFLGVGVLLFLSQTFNLSFWSLFWPLILIYFGARMLLRQNETHHFSGMSGVSDEDSVHESGLFSEIKHKVESKSFKGGSVDATFASFKLDLREAKLSPEGADLSVNATFGGVEIYVPEDMNIKPEGGAVLGGWNNAYKTSASKEGPVLKIRGSAIFGSVDIKN